VEVVAWVGLVVSWLLLVLIVKLVFVLLRVLKQMRQLAEMTRDAAGQLADNVADDEAFAQLELVAGRLAQAVRGLPTRPDVSGAPVSSVSPAVGGRPW
jgi:HAMP domain-containing protein